LLEVIEGTIKIISNFISSLYVLKIDITPDFVVNLGDLVVAFIVFVVSIYLVLRYFKIIGGDD